MTVPPGTVTHPDAAKRALRRLAHGARRGDPDATIIDRAANAVDDLDCAASFLDRHDLGSLSHAIADAERRGDRARARRGQRALAAFERFRRAA